MHGLEQLVKAIVSIVLTFMLLPVVYGITLRLGSVIEMVIDNYIRYMEYVIKKINNE